jgi:hypothetical protein
MFLCVSFFQESIEGLKKSAELLTSLQTSLHNLTGVVESVANVAEKNSKALQLFSQRVDKCCPLDGASNKVSNTLSASTQPSPVRVQPEQEKLSGH